MIDKLKHRFKLSLPGKRSQWKLAPEMRNQIEIPKEKTDAGVLIVLFPNRLSGDYSIVLIKRSSYNGHHSNQISFPGGKYESCDDSFEQTAIRETEEEIGIQATSIGIIGKLTELYIPVSNFLVHPYVGLTPTKPNFLIDKKEVDHLILCSIDDLITLPIKYTYRTKYKNIKIPYFEINGEMVWGATSMILNEFITILKQLP